MKALPPALDGLAGELRAEGEIDSRGTFTLDREQARAKMQKFQLADPRRYVLELVQAAVLRGAERIEFEIDADDMHLRFDGRPFTGDEFDDLYGSLFADGDGADLRALRQMALGLNAAQGMEPKHIRVESGVARLEIVPGREDRVTRDAGRVEGTHIHVKKRLRMAVLVGFFEHLLGSLAEEVHLVDRCVHSPVAIALDGNQISGGMRILGGLHLHELADAGEGFECGVAWVPSRIGEHGELRLIKDGVWIESIELTNCGPSVVAVVSSDRFKKDASQARIVADEARQRAIECAERARWGLLRATLESGEAAGSAAVESRVREELLAYVTVDAIAELESAGFVAERIGWRDCRGARPFVSLRSLVERYARTEKRGDRVGYGEVHYPDLKAEGDPVIELPRHELDPLMRIFGWRPRRRDRGLERAQRRIVARGRWLQRPMETTLPEHESFLFRTSFSRPGGITGQLGISANYFQTGGSDAPSRIWLIKEGKLLGQHEVELGIPHLWAAVEGPFVPTDEWDDATRDVDFARVMLEVVAALADPIAQLREGPRTPDQEKNVRGLLKRWLVLVLDPERQWELWVHAGVPIEAREACDAIAREILPDVAEILRSGAGSNARFEGLRGSPLFEDFDGRRVSIAELVARREKIGSLPYLTRGHQRQEGVGSHVSHLGRGDLRILGALFGEDALEPWDEQLASARAEAAFRAQAPLDFEATAVAMRRRLEAGGLDAAHFIEVINDLDGGHGLFCLAPTGTATTRSDSDGPLGSLGSLSLQLVLDGRALGEQLELEGGVGPSWAVVESERLTPSVTWDAAESDEGSREVSLAVERASSRVLNRLCAIFEELSSADRAFFVPILLHALADHRAGGLSGHAAAWPVQAQTLPLFTTIDDGALSVDAIEQIIADQGRIEHVSENEPWADLGEPPMVRASGARLEALRRLFAERLVDGSERMRRRHLARKIAALPALGNAVLPADAMMVRVDFRGGEAQGQVGIPWGRVDGGLRVVLGTEGRRVGELEDSGLAIPIDAVIEDPELPLLGDASVDGESRHVRRVLRRCRRMVPELMVALAESFGALEGEARELARGHLLGFVRAELLSGDQAGKARVRALAAVSEVPLLDDAWGGSHCVDAVRHDQRRGGSIDILTRPPGKIDGLDSERLAAMLGRRVYLVVGPTAGDQRKLLTCFGEVREIDHLWEREISASRALDAAPDYERPRADRLSLVFRSAQVSGGLYAELWIPRDPLQAWLRGGGGSSSRNAEMDVVFLRSEKVAARCKLLPTFPCEGHVDGESLAVIDGTPELSDRQWASLRRQVLVLYESLIQRVESDSGLASADRELALELLARVKANLGNGGEADPTLRGLGKVRRRVWEGLEAVVPPPIARVIALARQVPEAGTTGEAAVVAGRRGEPDPRPDHAKSDATRGAPRGAPASDGGGTDASTPADETITAPAELSARPSTPEQALIKAVHQNLSWAHARHGSALGRFGLDRLCLGSPPGAAIAGMGARGLEVRADHPLVSRMLADHARLGDFDPIDLAFVTAAMFTVLNYDAEEIADDDERAYVAHLVEALAVAVHAGEKPTVSADAAP
jgi:hypothetical protein